MKGGLRFAVNIFIFSILQGTTCIPIKYIKDRIYKANVKYIFKYFWDILFLYKQLSSSIH